MTKAFGIALTVVAVIAFVLCLVPSRRFGIGLDASASEVTFETPGPATPLLTQCQLTELVFVDPVDIVQTTQRRVPVATASGTVRFGSTGRITLQPLKLRNGDVATVIVRAAQKRQTRIKLTLQAHDTPCLTVAFDDLTWANGGALPGGQGELCPGKPAGGGTHVELLVAPGQGSCLAGSLPLSSIRFVLAEDPQARVEPRSSITKVHLALPGRVKDAAAVPIQLDPAALRLASLERTTDDLAVKLRGSIKDARMDGERLFVGWLPAFAETELGKGLQQSGSVFLKVLAAIGKLRGKGAE